MNSEPIATAREATIDDVAREVGVSNRTISRFVRNEGGYSAATGAKIEEAIRRLGYAPNIWARGMRTGRTGAIGLVIPNVSDPFFPELASGVQRAARDHGLTTLFTSTEGDADQQRVVLSSLRSLGADGLIVFPGPIRETDVAALGESGTPTVVIDQHQAGPRLSSVTVDLQGGDAVAMQHLLSLGRTKVAMVASDATRDVPRMDAYRDLLPDGQPARIEAAPRTFEGGYEATRRLVSVHPGIDAVLAYSDLMALGAIKALIETGHRVPEDVAVIGHGNIAPGAWGTPSLTTISYDRDLVGQEAVRLLFEMLDKPATAVQPVQVPVGEVVVRESA